MLSQPSFWPPRKPDPSSVWLLGGVACLVYRFGAQLLHQTPDDAFVGFALAFFGLWQGSEQKKRKDRDRDDPAEPEQRERTHETAKRPKRKQSSRKHPDIPTEEHP